MSESAAALVRTIAAVAGPDARPREDQVRAVEELLEHRRRVLVKQATGWGKSAVPPTRMDSGGGGGSGGEVGEVPHVLADNGLDAVETRSAREIAEEALHLVGWLDPA